MKRLKLAIIGQGRRGKEIHGTYYLSESNKHYDVAYVVEADARRREISKERYKGVQVLADYKELFDKKDIDLVVNTSFSYMHYEITKDLLEHGFNVLCEKPFVANSHECETLINLAEKNNLTLMAFQQTFYAPYYSDIMHNIKNKKLGDILQATIRFNGFSRRWDWQTLRCKMGGNAYNTGPHPFIIALGVLDFDKNWQIAFSRLSHTPLSSGDADDYCKVILTAPNKPIVDIEVNNTDAYSPFNVKLQGTQGTFICTQSKFECKYITKDENPQKTVEKSFLQDDNGTPLYCSENLITHEEKGEYNGTAFDIGTAKLYEELYYKITKNKKMSLTLSMISDTVKLTEGLYANSSLPVKF